MLAHWVHGGHSHRPVRRSKPVLSIVRRWSVALVRTRSPTLFWIALLGISSLGRYPWAKSIPRWSHRTSLRPLAVLAVRRFRSFCRDVHTTDLIQYSLLLVQVCFPVLARECWKGTTAKPSILGTHGSTVHTSAAAIHYPQSAKHSANTCDREHTERV